MHIPVSLSAATSSQGIDFDWLDQRSMEPVGYKRVNKVTGKEIERENIVKGVEYEKGRYVVLSEEEIRAAHPKSTQTIEIFAFVDSQEIPCSTSIPRTTWPPTGAEARSTRCSGRPWSAPARSPWPTSSCTPASTWRSCGL